MRSLFDGGLFMMKIGRKTEPFVISCCCENDTKTIF